MIIAAQNMDETHPFSRTACETRTTLLLSLLNISQYSATLRERSRASSRKRAPPLSHCGLGISVYGSQGCGVSR